MANFTICTIVFITQVLNRFTAAVDKEPSISSNYSHTNLHSNGDITELKFNVHSQLFCSYTYDNIIDCQQGEPLLTAGFCATYSNQTKQLSIIVCPYFQPNGYNYTSNGKISLPRTLSQLNDYMCGPMNRKGIVCSECADGFGPFRCIKCTNGWYEVPCFLFLELTPVTVFYIPHCFSFSNQSNSCSNALLNIICSTHNIQF